MSSDSPPSYESVVAHVQSSIDQFGTDIKPQHFLDTSTTLSPAQIDVLVKNHKELPPLTKEQLARYYIGVAEHLSADEAVVAIEAAAKEAANACNAIETVFEDMTSRLAFLDAKHNVTEPFSKELMGIHNDVRVIITTSEASAAKIANYCDAFVQTIVPLCQDEEIPIDQKKSLLSEYIKDAKAFEETATGVQLSFGKVGDRFNALVSKFGTWALEKDRQLDDEISALNKEIDDLEAKINKELLYLGIGVAIGATATVAIVAILACTPLAPFAWIAGAIGIGLNVIAIVTVMLVIKGQRAEIDRKKAEIESKKGEKESIKAARDALVTFGKEEYGKFKQHTGVLTTVWKSVVADAVNIQGKLDQIKTRSGINSTTRNPDPTEEVRGQAVGIYKAMEIYLRQYAKGIATSKISTSSSA